MAATWRATGGAIAYASSKDMLNVFNGTSSARIIRVYRNDFVVFFSAVDHLEASDDTCVHDAQRNCGILTEHEDVEGVTVVAICLRDETIICRVNNRAGHDAIHKQETRLFVDFVFAFRSARDFDDCVDDRRGFLANGNGVPRMPGIHAHVRPLGIQYV